MKESIREIVLATTNRGKLAELREMLVGTEIVVSGLDDYDELPPAVEDGDTFAENARRKAIYYSRLLKKMVLADDSGLLVDALDGGPGIYSARFAQVDAQDRREQDQANNEKLLELLGNIPPEKRTCRFCCCLCLSNPEEILVEVEGFVEGMITDVPRGSNGFGYDPIFYLPDRGKTIAQLPREEKNSISHRGRAWRKLIVQMQKFS